MILKIIIVLASVFIATLVSGKIIDSIIKAILRKEHNEQISRSILSNSEVASKIIGWLERFLIIVFIYIGYYQGIGFILAAKSILRYGEIKSELDRKFAEYVIVGTLLSFSVAITIGRSEERRVGKECRSRGSPYH